MNRLNIGRSSLQRLHFIGFFYNCQRSEIFKTKRSKKMSLIQNFQKPYSKGVETIIAPNWSLRCYITILYFISSLKKIRTMFRKLKKNFFESCQRIWRIWPVNFSVTHKVDYNSRFFTASSPKILAQKFENSFLQASRILFFMKKKRFFVHN